MEGINQTVDGHETNTSVQILANFTIRVANGDLAKKLQRDIHEYYNDHVTSRLLLKFLWAHSLVCVTLFVPVVLVWTCSGLNRTRSALALVLNFA